MRRILFKTFAVVLGLALGWYVAGSMTGPSFAGDAATGHGETSHVAAGHDPHSGSHDDASLAAAQMLVPRPGDADWYSTVLKIAAGLFIAAVVLGIPAMKLKGPEPAEQPAGDDHHSHDAGHGSHAAHH